MSHTCPVASCGGEMVEIYTYDKHTGSEIPSGTFQCRTPGNHHAANQNKRNTYMETEKKAGRR